MIVCILATSFVVSSKRITLVILVPSVATSSVSCQRNSLHAYESLVTFIYL
jgi:hypothetical protein